MRETPEDQKCFEFSLMKFNDYIIWKTRFYITKINVVTEKARALLCEI